MFMSRRFACVSVFCTVAVLLLSARQASGRANLRDAFFASYPNAVGSRIDTVPSHPTHCGVCHYDFGGSGPRNPYGVRLGQVLPNFNNNPNGRRQAVQSIQNEDPDGDGFSTLTEVTNTTAYSNTPTFPGLTPSNVSQVVNVSLSDIQGYLVPSSGADTTPPGVTVLSPNGGETLVANAPANVSWIATDAGGVASIDLYLSDDGGATFKPVALGVAPTGSHTWFPANRPTAQAVFKVVATDNSFNRGQDVSDAVFTIVRPPGGLVPTTLRDFDQPGSQPFEAGTLSDPSACAVCHGGYNAAVEPQHNWAGSMMAHASRDPLFEACLAIANQDAPDSGDLCLRCHVPRAWLRGRSVPTGGTQVLPEDRTGVSCDLCHRLVDPIYSPENPSADQAILAALTLPPNDFANGMFVVDPNGTRRGPFVDATSGHAVLVSPFHREAALCGTCHDVSNPAFEKDEHGHYLPNAFDAPSPLFSSHALMPIERTYSEWFYSAYNTPGGVYAPQFGGNRTHVATCQDCHMRDVTGKGCNMTAAPVRTDLPLHDMTGGSTWMPGVLAAMYPGQVDAAALQDGVQRARALLQNAADLAAAQQETQLKVTVTNQSGHKLPTGYPEGRRMWINVRLYDGQGVLLWESAAYDPQTAGLAHDGTEKIYEAKPGLDAVTAPIVGVPEGPSFHFVLNNRLFKDNRIPPRGFTNASYGLFGGTPIGASYADGQHWDETLYRLKPGAVSAQVRLYYQSTSREYVEFLRDANTTNSAGQVLYDAWSNHGKSPPELMASVTLPVNAPVVAADLDDDCDVDGQDADVYQACASGPGVAHDGRPECVRADFDGDGDVDQTDFAVMQRCFSGTDRLADPTCHPQAP